MGFNNKYHHKLFFYLYVFGVFDIDIGIVARYGLVDCLNLLPKETFSCIQPIRSAVE